MSLCSRCPSVPTWRWWVRGPAVKARDPHRRPNPTVRHRLETRQPSTHTGQRLRSARRQHRNNNKRTTALLPGKHHRQHITRPTINNNRHTPRAHEYRQAHTTNSRAQHHADTSTKNRPRQAQKRRAQSHTNTSAKTCKGKHDGAVRTLTAYIDKGYHKRPFDSRRFDCHRFAGHYTNSNSEWRSAHSQIYADPCQYTLSVTSKRRSLSALADPCNRTLQPSNSWLSSSR